MKRSLSELSPHEVLKVAISIEERNARIYENYAQVFNWYEPDVALEFSQMAAEERSHGQRLEQIYREKYGDLECDVTEEQVVEIVEAPVLEDGEVFIYDRMRRWQVLQIGLKAERFAREFYIKLAERVSDQELRALCRELAEIEGEHEAFFLRELEKLKAS
jgi:rubrerythrin